MEIEITPSIAAEAIAVLENTEILLLAKIPKNFIMFLQNKADEENAKFNLDSNLPYEKQSISEEARAIITLIYREYWCTDAERQALDTAMEKAEHEKEAALREKYNPDKIFEKDENSNMPNQNLAITVIEEQKWYEKIINKIKNIFGIK